MRKLDLKTFLITSILCGAALMLPIEPAGAQETPATPVAAPEKVLAPVAPDEAGAVFEAMMGALEANNRLVFIAAGDAGFKAAITPALFKSVVDMLAFRLEAGHEFTYLGELKRGGALVYLWRVRFKDDGADTLAEMSWKDGKVIGFLLR